MQTKDPMSMALTEPVSEKSINAASLHGAARVSDELRNCTRRCRRYRQASRACVPAAQALSRALPVNR